MSGGKLVRLELGLELWRLLGERWDVRIARWRRGGRGVVANWVVYWCVCSCSCMHLLRALVHVFLSLVPHGAHVQRLAAASIGTYPTPHPHSAPRLCAAHILPLHHTTTTASDTAAGFHSTLHHTNAIRGFAIPRRR